MDHIIRECYEARRRSQGPEREEAPEGRKQRKDKRRGRGEAEEEREGAPGMVDVFPKEGALDVVEIAEAHAGEAAVGPDDVEVGRDVVALRELNMALVLALGQG